MKFMVNWRVHEGKLHQIMPHFSQMTPEQDQADLGSWIKLIGRWHDLLRGRGVAICETDSAEAIAAWALNWNNVLDLDIAVVLDDKEGREVCKSHLKKS
jgi:hypothetical protein